MNLCLAIIESDGGPGFDGPPLFTARILNLYSQPSTRPSILPLILLPMASTSFTVNTLPSTHWPMLFSLGSDSPILLTARTLNLYLCPVVRFSTLILRGEPSSVLAHWTHEPFPPVVSMHSTTYFLIGVPPSSAGSLQ